MMGPRDGGATTINDTAPRPPYRLITPYPGDDRRGRALNLFTPDGRKIRSDAEEIIFAVMLQPNNRPSREAEFRTAHKITLGKPASADMSAAEGRARWAGRPGLAGVTLLHLIRLKDAGYRPSLNTASLLIAETRQEVRDPEDRDRIVGRGRQSEKTRDHHLSAWREYRSVVPYWAAYQLLVPTDILAPAPAPGILAVDPGELLCTAEHLTDHGSLIYLDTSQRRTRGRMCARVRERAVDPEKIWNFLWPAACRPPVGWRPHIPALSAQEREILSKFGIKSL